MPASRCRSSAPRKIDGQPFIDIVGAAGAEGVIITTALDRDLLSQTRGFIEDYEKTFAGSKADMVAASAHAAMKVVIENMRKRRPILRKLAT